MPNREFQGRLDAITGRCVEGWAFNPTLPMHRVCVEIWDGGQVVGEARADRLREDLAKAGIGDGHHGFRFLLPRPLVDGRAHEISVRIAGAANVLLEGSPRQVVLNAALADGSLEQAVGHLDPIAGRLVLGWVFDPHNPDRPLQVEILDGDVLFATAKADLVRPDLVSKGIGTGHHGFRCVLPDHFFHGRDRTISARLKETGALLDGSPRVIRNGRVAAEQLWQTAPVRSPSPPNLKAMQSLAASMRAQNEILLAETRALCRVLEREQAF